MSKAKFILIVTLSFLFMTLSSCATGLSTSLKHVDVNEEIAFKYSKEGVDDFYQLFFNLNKDKHVEEKETFYNVTTDNIKKLNISLFKDGKGETYLLHEDEIYFFAPGYGGYGFVNAITCDYDNNGTSDILYTYSYGSGVHRSEVALFDLTKFKLTVLFSTFVEGIDKTTMEDLVLEKRIVDNKAIYEAYCADLIFISESNDSFIVAAALKKDLFKVITLENYTSNEFISTKISKTGDNKELVYSKEKWLSASKSERGKMINSFLSMYNIKDVSYDQIIDYLGEPDQENVVYLDIYPQQFGGYVLIYYLSEQNDKYLEIKINSRKLVSSYELIL